MTRCSCFNLNVVQMVGLNLNDVKILLEVAVISTDDPPTGIGEAGVPAVAPAIASAVAQLTGKRLRHLPMTPDRVKQSLG